MGFRGVFVIYFALIGAKAFASTQGNQVISALQASNISPLKSLWSVNQIDSRQIAILQVPFLSESQVGVKPASGFVNIYKQLMLNAESSIDISSLDSQPGDTLNAIQDAIKQLSYQKPNSPITIRLIFGNIIGDRNVMSSKTILNTVTKDINPNAKFKIYVGIFKAGYRFNSWNHAKILSVDGKNLITGGINFIDSGYADLNNPVNDLSLEYPNLGLAEPASKFLDNEWRYLCKYTNHWTSVISKRTGNIQFSSWVSGNYSEKKCNNVLEDDYSFSSHHQLESDTSLDYAISVGRLAAITNWNDDASSTAQIALMNTASQTIKISQQGLYWPYISALYTFPKQVIATLCTKMGQGVTVEILMSGYKGQPGSYPAKKVDYSSFYTPDQLRLYMKSQCKTDYVASGKLEIRTNKNKVNLDTPSVNVANHSKVVIADSQLVYVGSHNTYDASHAEYGVIIDSASFVSRLNTEFWDYNWNTADTGI